MDRLRHAKHNESVCRYLSMKQEYADWVVTTAFYAALHFAEHKIFPYRVDGITFRTMDQYYQYARTAFPGKNRHGLRSDLVRSLCREIYRGYSWLFSTCNTARYFNFEFARPREVANQALDHLKAIKSYCSDN